MKSNKNNRTQTAAEIRWATSRNRGSEKRTPISNSARPSIVQTSATTGGGNFSQTNVSANRAPAAAYESRHHSRSQSSMRSGIERKTRALTEPQTMVAMATEIASDLFEPIRAPTT